LYSILGLTPAAVAKALSAELANGRAGATACAIVYLRKRLVDSADEWEMLVDKAVGWLEGQGIAVDTVLASVEKLF
jgi:hypothetical protein